MADILDNVLSNDELLKQVNAVRVKVGILEGLKSPLKDLDIASFKSLRESLDKRELVLKTRTLLTLELEDYQRELSIVNYFINNEIMFIQNNNTEKQYTVYWLSGERTVISGESISNAFMKAGYGGGAPIAIDWYDDGVTDTHEWDIVNKQWVLKNKG